MKLNASKIRRWVLYYFFNSHHNYLDPAPVEPTRQPFCSHFSDLPFSMFTMGHLPAVQEKSSLSIEKPEPFLLIPFFLQMNEFGNSVYQGLERVNGGIHFALTFPFPSFPRTLPLGSSTVWLQYTGELMEMLVKPLTASREHCITHQGKVDYNCIVGFLFFSDYHDIPLLHLANVLFTSNRLFEALIPLKIAFSFSPSPGPLLYTLGRIYAVSMSL